jgi:hypothetical protein
VTLVGPIAYFTRVCEPDIESWPSALEDRLTSTISVRSRGIEMRFAWALRQDVGDPFPGVPVP